MTVDIATHYLALVAGGLYLIIVVGFILWFDYETYKDDRSD